MNEQEKLALYKFNPNEYPLEPGLRLLEASAGTGKTFALAHLVLRLITERNHSINELLVVTFTEAAASELRARISTRIEEALAGLESLDKGLIRTSPDKVLEQWLELNGQEKAIRRKWGCLLLEALESIDCADITTIHGFCRRTLRREALDSNTSINPLVEEDSSELALEIIHDYWHSQVLSLSPRQLKGLKKANLSIEKLSQVLLTIDSDPSLQFKVDNNKIDISKPLVSQFDNWVQDNWYNFLSLWNQGGHLLESYLQSQASQWRSLGIKDTKPFSPKPIKNRFEILNKWVESFSEELDESTPPKSPSYEEIRSQNLLGNYFHPAVIVDTAQRCGE
ncbi:MAG: UvrD-helicase domain-containing protein, partial [Prochlorococcaceae cyanobacterium ETNP1_MAG_9]|nr:UvrD-helicase domain-containing protein [Prochlorococcaceae cyanobacterium ETNP1_MAG_9]